MEIRYEDTLPDPDAYHALFEGTGWNEVYRIDKEDIEKGLGHCWRLVAAYHDERLVGFGRLLSDGVLYAVVFDMIVDPEYQGLGIGSRILEILLAHCEKAGIRDVLLFSAAGKAEFYAKYGFVRRPGDSPGMLLRRSGSEAAGT